MTIRLAMCLWQMTLGNKETSGWEMSVAKMRISGRICSNTREDIIRDECIQKEGRGATNQDKTSKICLRWFDCFNEDHGWSSSDE